ncbi:MAG: hypothetical protein FWG31_07615 [Oscillospiraceae bacterium]|nr:hypothetical protein [Oscillospiraceae bacterium]
MQTNEWQWHCVDKTGTIILALGEGEVPASNFSHGVALVRRVDWIVELIDKNGRVISSPKSGEYDNIVGFIPDVGMTLVDKYLDTFRLIEYQVGIIDNNGNWTVKLCNDFILLNFVNISNSISPK